MAHSGVQLASEKKLRLIAKEMIGENLEAEIAPFCFSRTSCEDEIRAAAYAYTPSLIQKVTNLIDENERYMNIVKLLSNSIHTAP